MITLQIKEGDIEILDGFPEYVEFEASEPATVYYTLDGSLPGEDSLVAVGRVYLPMVYGTLVLKAIAVAGDSISQVLEREFKNDSTGLSGPRILEEGIVVMRYDDEAFESLALTADGGAAQSLSSEKGGFEIKASTTDSKGEQIPEGKTTRDFINFASQKSSDGVFDVSSPNNNVNFNPEAKFIIIDGFTQEAKENQVVKIVNRPYNTFGTTTNFYKERLGEKQPIITGNFVRSFYNQKTNKYVSYYWESLESRWIRSEQRVEMKAIKINPGSGKRFVYRWIQDRALSQLF